MLDYRKIADRLYPEKMPPSVLDEFLSNGWYRMGQSIFTTHFLFYENHIYSAIWLRVLLDDFTFSKSLRKLLSKNKKIFSHKIVEFKIDDEIRELYDKYIFDFKGNISFNLEQSLMDGQDVNIYHSLLFKVYSDDNLIACSILDIGKESVSSISGIYDPDFRSYSLGLYTMLLELEYAIQEKKTLYYPGYFVPGNPRFDYKLRLKNMEYLEFGSNVWSNMDTWSTEDIPITIMRRQMDKLHQDMLSTNTQCKHNPFVEANLIEFWPLPYIEYPIYISLIGDAADENSTHIIVYNLASEKYDILNCTILKQELSNYNHAWIEQLPSETYHKTQLCHDSVLFSSKKKEDILEWVSQNGYQQLS